MQLQSSEGCTGLKANTGLSDLPHRRQLSLSVSVRECVGRCALPLPVEQGRVFLGRMHLFALSAPVVTWRPLLSLWAGKRGTIGPVLH